MTYCIQTDCQSTVASKLVEMEPPKPCWVEWLEHCVLQTWNTDVMIRMANKSTCPAETWIKKKKKNPRNHNFIEYQTLKAKNGTNYIITYCTINFWPELDSSFILHMETTALIFLSNCSICWIYTSCHYSFYVHVKCKLIFRR